MAVGMRYNSRSLFRRLQNPKTDRLLVARPDGYAFVYGTMSESTHGSWNETIDWCLTKNHDGTFSANPHFVGVDARAMLPLVRYTTPAYALWIERIRPRDESLQLTLDRIQDYARSIYFKFDELYVEPAVPAGNRLLPAGAAREVDAVDVQRGAPFPSGRSCR